MRPSFSFSWFNHFNSSFVKCLFKRVSYFSMGFSFFPLIFRGFSYRAWTCSCGWCVQQIYSETCLSALFMETLDEQNSEFGGGEGRWSKWEQREVIQRSLKQGSQPPSLKFEGDFKAGRGVRKLMVKRGSPRVCSDWRLCHGEAGGRLTRSEASYVIHLGNIFGLLRSWVGNRDKK